MYMKVKVPYDFGNNVIGSSMEKRTTVVPVVCMMQVQFQALVHWATQ